jgi:hypothetical protein
MFTSLLRNVKMNRLKLELEWLLKYNPELSNEVHKVI